MEKKTDKELREIYNTNYPAPTYMHTLSGIVCFVVCAFSVAIAKFATHNSIIIIAFIGIFFTSSVTVYFLRKAWDCFDFNKVAERFFREKGR